jgi:hypothetical protein
MPEVEIQQKVTQHTAADTGQHSEGGDAEQVEPIPEPDHGTRSGEHGDGHVIDEMLDHARAVEGESEPDGQSGPGRVETRHPLQRR